MNMYEICRRQRRQELLRQLKYLGLVVLVAAMVIIGLWGTTAKLP